MRTVGRALEAVDERQAALRALLARPFIDVGDPIYALVRRHETELARACSDVFGYRLDVGSTSARLSGMPTAASLRRPLRVRPQTVSGARRPVDEWRVLSDRAGVLVCLTLVALERGGSQIAVVDLAREVQRSGADAAPPIIVDFDQRRERLAFADGLDLLCGWGVLQHTSGSRESYARHERDQDADEALMTIDRRRLTLLLRDPLAALEAATLDGLLDESAAYAPSEEGEHRHRSHRLARRLVEDPALILADLHEEDRVYFLGQRARLENAVADVTGVAVERRAEGTALIVDERALTDLPFPTNATAKQVALLLCDALALEEQVMAIDRVRAAVRELMRRHRPHWQRDPDDPAQLDELVSTAVETLCDLDLAVREGGGIRARPLCARFRDPTLRRAGEQA